MAISGQDLKDELYLVEIMADTELEQCHSDQEEEFELLLCLLAAAHGEVVGRQAKQDVIDMEANDRFFHGKEEEMQRNRYEMQYRFAVLGASEHTSLVPPALVDAQEEEAAWKSMPTIIEGQQHVDTVTTSQALISELRSNDDDGFFVMDLAISKLVRKEDWTRCDIVAAADADFARFRRRFDKYSDELLSMEANLEDDVRRVMMSRMNVEDRLQFACLPATTKEENARNSIVFDAEWGMQRKLLAFTEEFHRIALHTRFVETRAELRDKEHARKHDTMQFTVFRTHGIARFNDWRLTTSRNATLRRGKKAVAVLSRRRTTELLRRYCASWNEVPQERTARRQRQDMAELETNLYVYLVASEEEERARNAIVMDEGWDIAQMAEVFLSERDKHRKVYLESVCLSLQPQSNNRHRMRRLITWYRHWKGISHTRRAAWLLSNSSTVTTRRYFASWLSFRRMFEHRRHGRWGMEKESFQGKERLFAAGLEGAFRLAIEVEEAQGASQLFHDGSSGYVSAAQRSQERALALLSEDCQAVQRKFRFHQWLHVVQRKADGAQAMSLLTRTHESIRREVFRVWMRRQNERIEDQSSISADESHHRAVILLESEEFFSRAVVEERERWSRVRRDFRTANVLGVGSRHSLSQALDTFNEKLSTATMEVRFHIWKKFLGRRNFLRKQVLVVEHMEYELDLLLYRRYFATFKSFATGHSLLQWEADQADKLRRSVEEIERERGDERGQIEEEEEWNFTRIQLSHVRGEAVLRRKQQDHQVELMLGRLQLSTQRHILLHVFHEYVNYKKRMRMIAALVAQKESALHHITQLHFLKKWKVFWWHRIRPKLAEEMRVRNDHVLLRRYYRLLAPAVVRQARISRARENLERAQEAARLLQESSGPASPAFSGTVRVVRSHNPFLPPLTKVSKRKQTQQRAADTSTN